MLKALGHNRRHRQVFSTHTATSVGSVVCTYQQLLGLHVIDGCLPVAGAVNRALLSMALLTALKDGRPAVANFFKSPQLRVQKSVGLTLALPRPV